VSSETIQCGFELCECMVTAPLDPDVGEPGEAYCSDACRNASDDVGACPCGHPPCDA
jgi:hypothetical protein